MPTTAIVGARVLTMDEQRREISAATALIEDYEIAMLGPSADVVVPGGVRIVDGRGKAMIPGLINAHTHVPQILLRGGASHDRNLSDWLFNVLYPGLSEYGDADISCASLLYAVEALLGGVTTIVNNDHVAPHRWLAAARAGLASFGRAGLRVIYARMFSDEFDSRLPGYADTIRATEPEVADVSVRRPLEAALRDLDQLVDTFHGSCQGRVSVWPSPASLRTVSIQGLQASAELAARRGLRWALHLAETPLERTALSMGSADWADRHGLLDERLLAAHCVDVDARDIRLLARNNVAVSTQPVSNCFLGSGVAPVPALLGAGLAVAVGTDDANCNNSANLLGDLKTLALLHRGVNADAGVITPERVLEMATVDGARALGMSDRIGSIEVGKRADLVLLDLARPNLVPCHNLAATLVFQANGSEVSDVFVDGRQVVAAGRPTFLSAAEQAELLADAGRRSTVLLAGARVAATRSWRRSGR
jgi:atrazine chlorohydrolase/5-methylthioadenosine/S-adenosylhomocysteine deaminase/melamine deaminase